jgi:beta-galactosidase
MLFVLSLLVAGNVRATEIERLEAKYLKSRIKLRIDEDWKVKVVQTGRAPGAGARNGRSNNPAEAVEAPAAQVPGEATVNFNDAAWSTVNVPHDMSITLVSTSDSDPGAIGWYRKHFTLPPGFAGKKVIVQFDGVYEDSKIYLNGTQVGNQRFGYISFNCDLTPYLNVTGDNVLSVFVDNLTSRRSHFYSGTGIYRHVWLIATDKAVYIPNWGTAVTTPVVGVAESQIKVQTDLANDLPTAQTRNVETTIYDEAGKALKTGTTAITVDANSSNSCFQTLTLPDCKLWSPATPVRYYAYTRILDGTKPTDDYVSAFGIRELKYSATEGFTINGVSMKLKGVCVHHDLIPGGAAVPDSMWERIIKELLASGCTEIRTSHNPQAPEFYDCCDRLGMMVMDEYCDKWARQNAGSFYADFDQVWPKDLTGFIERDRNHPSIVIWSLGNEILAEGKIPAYMRDTLKMLVPFAKKLDSTRPYTHASVSGWSDAPGLAALAEVEDVVGVNYQDFLFPQIHRANPNAILIGTEQDPYLARSGGSPTWYEVRNVPYVIGHNLWTGVDYLGESRNSLGGQSGFLDNCGFRKSWFYFMQSQWGDKPMVHIAVGNGTSSANGLGESWNQPLPGQNNANTGGRGGRGGARNPGGATPDAVPAVRDSGQPVNPNQSNLVSVVTYTSCDTVDLYVNSTKIGTKKSSDFAKTGIMQWTGVPWEAGVIKAVGMKDGKEVAVDSIKTAGVPAKLVLKPDRTTLYADGSDASSIEVDIVDADGNPVFAANNTIQFAMTGSGRSVGIASGDFMNNEPFKATSRKAYHGKSLIVIQSLTVPGTINVTVSSEGLTPATLTLTTRPQ